MHLNEQSNRIKILETPRDGFQGLSEFIPTDQKIKYINQLLQCGFDTVEVGSFVSPRAIPQMADTAEVLNGIDTESTSSRIMVLTPNVRGGEKIMQFPVVDDVLFPHALSETFLNRNLNISVQQAKDIIKGLLEVTHKHEKNLIVYLSFSFGNPYGDPWSVQAAVDEVGWMTEQGLRIIPLTDILGCAKPETITEIYTALFKHFPDVEFGAHFHVKPGEYRPKIEAEYAVGVRRFDTVLGGYGGCPMAGDELVSNLNTFDLIQFCDAHQIEHGIDLNILDGLMY